MRRAQGGLPAARCRPADVHAHALRDGDCDDGGSCPAAQTAHFVDHDTNYVPVYWDNVLTTTFVWSGACSLNLTYEQCHTASEVGADITGAGYDPNNHTSGPTADCASYRTSVPSLAALWNYQDHMIANGVPIVISHWNRRECYDWQNPSACNWHTDQIGG